MIAWVVVNPTTIRSQPRQPLPLVEILLLMQKVRGSTLERDIALT
jgi:hypothetical protein